MGRLDGKVGIVTGAASGIGRAIAIALAGEGARVMAADVNEGGLAQTAAAGSGAVLTKRCDVTRSEDVKALVDETVGAFGGLHVLCNNAGISIPNRVTELSEDDWDRTLAVNLKGVFLGCKYGIPAMLRSGGGSIINTGSVNSLVAEPYLSAYCASKGGVLMLTKEIALDFAREGIRCNCICPGWVDTPINTPHAQMMGGLDKVLAGLPEWQPIGRQGYPKEIASVVVFLASDDSSFMTGSAVVVDGGMTAK
jgi:meso-butanediol dehydrogenase / (S,S)-butanediol dehydrogenase / diacetyl reductase